MMSRDEYDQILREHHAREDASRMAQTEEIRAINRAIDEEQSVRFARQMDFDRKREEATYGFREAVLRQNDTHFERSLWWGTYNAILQGLLASQEPSRWDVNVARQLARIGANDAHGVLDGE